MRICDPGFWTVALAIYAQLGQDVEPWYKIFLPWLAQKSLVEVFAASDALPFSVFRTMQYAETDFYKVIKHGIMHVLRRELACDAEPAPELAIKWWSFSLRKTLIDMVLKILTVGKLEGSTSTPRSSRSGCPSSGHCPSQLGAQP